MGNWMVHKKVSRSMGVLVLLLWACGAPPESVEGAGGVESSSGAQEQLLARQEKKVAELRKSHGIGRPETLIAIAELIRLRTASGDLESGAELFDEILDLDVRSSPVLAHGEPPIELTRNLGGIGELEASLVLLKKAVKGPGGRIGNLGQNFALQAYRARARLHLALEQTPEAIEIFENLAAGQEQAKGVDDPIARALRHDLAEAMGQEPEGGGKQFQALLGRSAQPPINFSNRPSIGRRDRNFFLPQRDHWSDGTGGHEHFDVVLDIGAKPALETAERLRATLSPYDLSLVTRLRQGRAHPDAPPPILPRGQEPPVGGIPSPSADLKEKKFLIQALTRALDRIPFGDPRLEAIRKERERLQQDRTQDLNTSWNSTEVVYIPVTVPDLQRALDPGTLVLYYMVGEDHVDLLSIPTEGEAKKHHVALSREALAEEVNRFLSSPDFRSTRGAVLIDEPTQDSQEEGGAAVRLFQALIAPVAEVETAKRLLIIADGPLHQLPFGALKRSEDGGPDDYLGAWKPIHLAPSAAGYIALVERRPETRQDSPALVAFGNPDYQSAGEGSEERSLPFAVRTAGTRGFSGGLAPLPGSEREVQEIGRLFGSRAQILLGAAAGEGAAKTQVEAATYLHFAVHGFVDSEQPEHSFLALSLPSYLREGDENGILESWEIVDGVVLNAELVALSACETALGKQRGGEGPASLNRAFLAAGARSVLASLWKVDDQATAELMVDFYRHILAGKSKDQALQAAQQDLRASGGGFEAPYFWAGFQLTGDWQ